MVFFWLSRSLYLFSALITSRIFYNSGFTFVLCAAISSIPTFQNTLSKYSSRDASPFSGPLYLLFDLRFWVPYSVFNPLLHSILPSILPSFLLGNHKLLRVRFQSLFSESVFRVFRVCFPSYFTFRFPWPPFCRLLRVSVSVHPWPKARAWECCLVDGL